MEGYPYTTYPESGDSSPQCREIDGDTAISWDETPQPAAVRVKLMCSYGGRIQPRPHDNQLSYFGGETKILAVDRSIRFPAIIAKLSSLYGANSPDEICFKYQLPGEDLDALISVTNDEDLDHMMIEYDRLHLSSGKPAARLRLFLFPANPSISSGKGEQKADRMWFLEPLLPSQLAPSMDHNPLQLPPPPPPALVPDFLSGIVPPPVVLKAKETTPDSLVVDTLANDALSAGSDLAKEETPQNAGETVVSPSAEVQRHIQEIQRLQIAENQFHPPANVQRNGSDETLSTVYHGEFYAPRIPDKGLPPPAPAATLAPSTAAATQIPTAYWADQRGIAGGRFTSLAGGDQPVYLIPASHGLYPPTTGQAYYTATHPPPPAFSRVVPADVYRDVPTMYTVAPPPGRDAAPANSPASGYTTGQVAYDSMGRAVFYPGPVATYQAVANVALTTESKMTKPSQLS
ncbi:uncharacterized protein LOC110112842 [Dendrobium catenatum]|uniref:PB1 domain-containing protein n=1 Tax=Dendrobium catenatum TaxID=906689 RepID=A0A2I0VGW4_9ASPA|nr:uncharacterized protein LOC110112842 [Dendrobium catenatum]PKU62633.1 hypothetical protein MA16_Dca016581 [Dendrobium catenatum]